MNLTTKSKQMNTEDKKIIQEASDRAYKYLYALGHFTTPTKEARIVENLLIQARVRSNEIAETLEVVLLKSELKSFSWNDGLHAIQKVEDGIIHLWKIKDGKLDRYDNGTPNITCTGVRNKGISKTDLTIQVK